MTPTVSQKPRNKERRPTPTVSAVFSDGKILELIYDAEKKRSSFALWEDGAWRTAESHRTETGEWFVPYSPWNNLIKNQVVHLPQQPEEYGTEDDLIRAIRHFIRTYVDISPRFELIASYYALFSWVYDGFNELPYLRVRGDYGSGKTRFLLTVGSICYKPIFASGATSTSAMFRILDVFRGTLIIDEADFRNSDEMSDVTKILNCGFVKGLPVLRTEVSQNREFNPRAFQVFGPKLVATRGYYQDRGLESRHITEEMGGERLRRDIPINLPASHKDEALRLRNQLLLYRFRNLHTVQPDTALVDPAIEPRLNQIFIPLMSIVSRESVRQEFRLLARQYHKELLVDRSMAIEGQLLEVIRDMVRASERTQLSIKEISRVFIETYGAEYERSVTPKWLGGIIRRKLRLKTQKSSHGVFVIPPDEIPKLKRLYERYGIEELERQERPEEGSEKDGNILSPQSDNADVADVGYTDEEGADTADLSVK